MTKENIAAALSGLVAQGKLDTSQAEFICERIFFANPNELFTLGL